MTIAVIGATGNTGRAVVKELKALGQNPVCVVRNADKAHEVLGADAKIAIAELTDRAALEKALARRRHRVRGAPPRPADGRTAEQRHRCRTQGRRQISGAALRRPRRSPNRIRKSVVGRGHHAIEERLRNANIGWVILRPGLFMQNVIGAGGIDQERQQDRHALRRGFPDGLDRRARYRRGRRAHPHRSGAAWRQDLCVHRRDHQLRRIRRGVSRRCLAARSPTCR